MGGWHRTALKRCLRRETHRTPIRRMAEAKFLGMEIETVARRAIEHVTAADAYVPSSAKAIADRRTPYYI